MARRFTTILVPGMSMGSGLQDHGRVSAKDMIEQYRRYWRHQKALADAILGCTDRDFRVITHVNATIPDKIEVLQEGRFLARHKVNPERMTDDQKN